MSALSNGTIVGEMAEIIEDRDRLMSLADRQTVDLAVQKAKIEQLEKDLARTRVEREQARTLFDTIYTNLFDAAGLIKEGLERAAQKKKELNEARHQALAPLGEQVEQEIKSIAQQFGAGFKKDTEPHHLQSVHPEPERKKFALTPR